MSFVVFYVTAFIILFVTDYFLVYIALQDAHLGDASFVIPTFIGVLLVAVTLARLSVGDTTSVHSIFVLLVGLFIVMIILRWKPRRIRTSSRTYTNPA